MIKKQFKIIVIALIAIIVLVATYVILTQTILKPGKDNTPTKGNHGETLVNKRPLIVDQVEREELQEIKVTNQYGTYKLYRGSDDEFYFEGLETLQYDSERVSKLIVNSGYLLAMQEVEDYNKDLSVYGLASGEYIATIEVKTIKGDQYKVFVGDKIVTSGGYYVMLENRDAVYILDTGLEESVLCQQNDYIVAQVADAVPQSDYNSITNFSLKKNGERFMEIKTAIVADQTTGSSSFKYTMEYPGAYVPSTSNYGTVLTCFINFTGDKVVESGLSNIFNTSDDKKSNDETATDETANKKASEKFKEILKSYGFFDENNKFYYQLSYDYNGKTNNVYISKKSENNTYFILSPNYEIIAEFSADKLPWLEWTLIDWVDSPLYQQSINDVSTYKIVSDGKSTEFTLRGTGDDLIVSANKKIFNTADFRQFYKQFLYCSNLGYADNTGITDPSFEIYITMRKGNIFDFKFFDIETRKSYYTINDEGKFYINREYITKLKSDLAALLNGQTLEATMIN